MAHTGDPTEPRRAAWQPPVGGVLIRKGVAWLGAELRLEGDASNLNWMSKWTGPGDPACPYRASALESSTYAEAAAAGGQRSRVDTWAHVRAGDAASSTAGPPADDEMQEEAPKRTRRVRRQERGQKLMRTYWCWVDDDDEDPSPDAWVSEHAPSSGGRSGGQSAGP